MSELQSEILKICSPFYKNAVDYFCPITAKISRNKNIKNYGVIFTCLNTRAVELDVKKTVCSGRETSYNNK
jgi:hypothetical protein